MPGGRQQGHYAGASQTAAGLGGGTAVCPDPARFGSQAHQLLRLLALDILVALQRQLGGVARRFKRVGGGRARRLADGSPAPAGAARRRLGSCCGAARRGQRRGAALEPRPGNRSKSSQQRHAWTAAAVGARARTSAVAAGTAAAARRGGRRADGRCQGQGCRPAAPQPWWPACGPLALMEGWGVERTRQEGGRGSAQNCC